MAQSSLCKCGQARRAKQRNCLACHAKSMREFRHRTPLRPDQAYKDNCRSYAGVYLRRGKLLRQPCKCSAENSQMHHPDYSKPLQVEWLCRPCHLELHASQ